MFKWNEGVTDETKASVGAGLDALADLPSVSAYQHGGDLGISDGNWDYVVVGDFDNADDYAGYATDPGHLELIADLIKPNISARAAVQYELS